MSLSLEQIQDAVVRAGSIRKAEKLLADEGVKISERTLRRALNKAHRESYTVDQLPDAVDVVELIERRQQQFHQKHAVHKAAEWLTVRMKDNTPIGVGLIGDLHLDNDGTDLRKVFNHAEVFSGTIPGMHGIFMGDATDNWVGRLKALWADTGINAAESRALLKRYFEVVQLLAAIGGNHDCLDPAHEVLTKRGWRHYTDLAEDDMVLGFNPETQAAEWQPILMITTRPNNQKMIRGAASGAQFLCTPGHRMLTQRRRGALKDYNNPWEFRTAEELGSYFAVPTAGYSTNPKSDYSPGELDARAHDFDLEFVMSLDQPQFDYFLESVIGHYGIWCSFIEATIHLSRREDFDILQAGCVSHGWSTKVMRGELTVRKTNTVSMTKQLQITTARPSETVWCLTVPLGNFMTRFRGSCHFTGNCWNDGIDILQLLMGDRVERLTKHQQKVKIVFPNGREVRFFLRHGFPGRSQWVPQFGALKAAQLDGSCDIYAGAHTHVSGYSHGWHDGSQRMWHAVQVASYKTLDDYPVELGLPNREIYCCPVAVIDPLASLSHNLIRWEWDPHEGADRVTWMRSKRQTP
jgi:hypothetical protein